MGIPAIYVPAGPMLRGNWRGEYLGSGSDVWKYWTEKRAGNITEAEWAEIEGGIARSFGTCMVMGTAATMMAIAEALGMALPGASSIPAADAAHPRMGGASRHDPIGKPENPQGGDQCVQNIRHLRAGRVQVWLK